MSNEQKILWSVVAGVLLLVVVLALSGGVEERLSPEPRAARVAVEVAGEGVARSGPVELAAGTPFSLHAVLEAVSWSGAPIYYTEAARLILDGQEVPPESLRPWTETEDIRILWFTVEGYSPFLQVSRPEDLDSFHFRELFRADWPRAWSIPGEIQNAAGRLQQQGLGVKPRFGTQRFHVRIEIFGPESEISPRARFLSPRAEDLPDGFAEFPTVVAALPGNLSIPSRTFGLTQIEADPEILPTVAGRLAVWSSNLVAFSKLTVIRQMLDASRLSYDELLWQPVDLAAGPPWGAEGAAGGDLVRVGERLVILLEDRGTTGRLDHEDLCLDYDKGAKVQSIREVFVGEGLVEWARLSPPVRSPAA